MINFYLCLFIFLRKSFPGAQPVSMDMRNINNLRTKKYMVSWKADGTRYLMMVNGEGKVYMLDRENSVFNVRNLRFPHRKNLDVHLSNTLLDGEFVMDVDPNTNQKIPRFLIYDIIKFEVWRKLFLCWLLSTAIDICNFLFLKNDDVGKMNFTVRLQCISKEIIFARDEAFKQGKLNKQIEPFSIRQKLFYKLRDTKKVGLVFK
jgi:mRNA-capping enzyme